MNSLSAKLKLNKAKKGTNPQRIPISQLMDAIHFKIIKELGKNDIIVNEVRTIQSAIKSETLPDMFLTSEDFHEVCDTWKSNDRTQFLKRISQLDAETRRRLVTGQSRFIDTTIEIRANAKNVMDETFLMCGVAVLSEDVTSISVIALTNDMVAAEKIIIPVSDKDCPVYYELMYPKFCIKEDVVEIKTENNMPAQILLRGVVIRKF